MIYLSGFEALKNHIKFITALISKKLRDIYDHMVNNSLTKG